MQKGIIISNISNTYIVEVNDEEYICYARGKFKNQTITPLVGDNVEIDILDENKKEGIITDIFDRKNTLKRPKMANLTQLILVLSTSMPKPDFLLLDKQLAFAELNNIKPIICINKMDLIKKDKEEIQKNCKIYRSIGYKVIESKAKQGIGIEDIKKLLKNNITAFSGNSGVGKSTLINGIFGKEITTEGLVSQKNKRGKNTTTITKLYKIDDNSYIADTPGFSTFDISEIASVDLYKYFKEFKEKASECEFVGCTHIKEENCGIKNAILNGEISSQRYDRFCKIYNELKEMEAHKW